MTPLAKILIPDKISLVVPTHGRHVVPTHARDSKPIPHSYNAPHISQSLQGFTKNEGYCVTKASTAKSLDPNFQFLILTRFTQQPVAPCPFLPSPARHSELLSAT